MVYDMSDHNPTTAIYDFHHNVRDLTWDQTPKEGFHPIVYVEAGGHRHLWGIGEHDTDSKDYGGGKIRARGINLDPIFDIMIAGLSSGNVIPFTLEVSKFEVFWYDITNSVPPGVDWFVAQSLKEMIKEANAKKQPDVLKRDVLVGWRALHPTFNTDIDANNRVPDTSNFRLNVERDMGDRWVWIAGVKEEKDGWRVTYEGNNIYKGENHDLWPLNEYYPWYVSIGNTVRQAWDWNANVAKDSGGKYYYTSNIQSATRGYHYYTSSAKEFANLLGDKHGSVESP
jgi:hypothetical protein